MARNAAHTSSVIMLGALAILMAAAAGLAQAFGWEGRWALMLAVSAVIVGTVAGLVDKVLVPRLQALHDESEDDARARAVELMLMRDGDRTELAVLNTDRYEVTAVQIQCWPAEQPSGHNQPLLFDVTSRHPHVTCERIGGGGDLVEVTDLPPLSNPGTATGLVLGSWHLTPGTPSRVFFEVDWLDHQRRAHRLAGAADLREFVMITAVDLHPPAPLVTAPTWRWRLRNALGRTDM
jgi:hypothetical protein